MEACAGDRQSLSVRCAPPLARPRLAAAAASPARPPTAQELGALPKTLAAFKASERWVLERHIGRTMALRPGAVLGGRHK